MPRIPPDYFFLLPLLFILNICSICHAQNLDELKVSRTNNLGYLPFIAEKKGLLEKAGIKVKPNKLQTGKMAADSLVSGDADVATIVDSNISFNGFINKDLRVISVLGSKLDDTIYYLKDSGIFRYEDLKGKRIGYIPATTSHISLSRLLEKHNIKWSDIKPVVVQPPAMNTALRNKMIDAACIWQPFGYNITQEFKDNIGQFENSSDIYVSYILLATTAKFLAQNRRLLERYIKVLADTQAYCEQNTNECHSLFAPEIGTTTEAMPLVTRKFRYTVSADNNVLRNFNEIGKWIIETQENFKGNPLPDYSSMIEFIQ